MVDELERNNGEQTDLAQEEKPAAPRSKYERIMLAAAEAGRLNEEMRRKGIRLDHKVTIEAIKRVDEGKVVGRRGEEEMPEDLKPEAPAETSADTLFGGSLDPSPAPPAPVGGNDKKSAKSEGETAEAEEESTEEE